VSDRYSKAVLFPCGLRYLTTMQVAIFLQIGMRTAYKYMRNGTIKASMCGKRRRVKSTDLIAYMQANGMDIPEDLAKMV
jgi:excisionase family DNA binding protein